MKVKILNPTRFKAQNKQYPKTQKKNTMQHFRKRKFRRRRHNPTISVTRQGISNLIVDAGSSVAGGLATHFGYTFVVNNLLGGQRPSQLVSLLIRAGIPLGLGYFLQSFNSGMAKSFMLGGLGYAGTQAVMEMTGGMMMMKKKTTAPPKPTLKGYDLSLGELAEFEEVGEIEQIAGYEEDLQLVGEIEQIAGYDEFEEVSGASSSGSSATSNRGNYASHTPGFANDSRLSNVATRFTSGFGRAKKYDYGFDTRFNPYQSNSLP